MNQTNENFSIMVNSTKGTCPIGERMGKQNLEESKIPVLSCEGACIRGEIARLAAHMVAKENGYARACHGELLTVPHSAISHWVKAAQEVVLIDGCFLHCHGRALKNLIAEDKLIVFDALPMYKKYTDIFDIDDVPETERKEVARMVADKIITELEKDH